MSSEIVAAAAKAASEGHVELLAPFIDEGALTKHEMVSISHQLLRATRARPNEVAPRLRQLMASHNKGPNRVLDRLALHTLDATWFENKDRAMRRKALRRLLTEFESRYGDISAIQLYRGGLLLNEGDRSSAFPLFEAAAEGVAKEYGLMRMYVGAHSVKSSDWNVKKQGNLTKTPIHWVRRPSKKGAASIILAADMVYFSRFWKFILYSIRRYDIVTNVHFHIVNYDNSIDFDGIENISISSEDYRHRRDFTYFATVRFYRAFEIMKEIDGDVYITDIDNQFESSLSDEIPALRCHDGGFRYHGMGDWFPWWAPSGGNLWLRNNDKGRLLASWMETYIYNRFQENSQFSWWFDQLCLNEIRHKALDVGMNITNLHGVSVIRPYDEIAHLKSKY